MRVCADIYKHITKINSKKQQLNAHNIAKMNVRKKKWQNGWI